MNDLVDMAAAPDPWVAARAEAALNAIVFKHVDLIKGEECFVEIPRTDKAVAAGLDLYDGATIKYFSPQPHVSETNIVLADDHAGAPA